MLYYKDMVVRSSLVFSAIFLFSLGVFSNDSTTPPNSSPIKRVTKVGSNRQAIFISNSGFVFVSSKRRSHRDDQLYFYDLKKAKEKRLTYQRGMINNGSYDEKQKRIFYSSSTDEDKETPLVLKKQLSRFPSQVNSEYFYHLDFTPQELYSSRLDGSDIKRLTNSMGFEGFPSFLSSKNRIYFSKWDNKQLRIHYQKLKGTSRPRAVNKTAGHDLGLQLSSDQKKFVWARFSPDFKSSQIVMDNTDFKSPQFITLDSGLHWSPTWHPNGQSVIYSAKTTDKNHFDLYEISTNGECKRQITSLQGDQFFPAVSPDGQTLVFTSTHQGDEQIYQLPYPGPLNCDKRDTASSSQDN